MLFLAAASIAVISTGIISVTSVFLCRRPPGKLNLPEPPLIFTLTGGVKDQPFKILNSRNKEIICEFHRSSSFRVVNNLYRLFGSVSIANSEKEVALLYRNTVGNGGYIEFWSHNTQLLSILYSFLSRFHGKDTEETDPVPLRIYISSKLTHGTYELVLDDSAAKYLWSADDRELYNVIGNRKKLAAKVRDKADGTQQLLVHRDVINPYLAVCTVLFFTHQAKHR